MWDEELKVGIEEIDAQHHGLFQRMAALAEACGSGRPEDEVRGMLAFLDEYVETHFATEEGLMKRYEYPDFQMHRMQHEVFTQHLAFIHREVRTKGVSLDIVMQVNQMLIDWLRNHILNVDKVTCAYLKSRLL